MQIRTLLLGCTSPTRFTEENLWTIWTAKDSDVDQNGIFHLPNWINLHKFFPSLHVAHSIFTLEEDEDGLAMAEQEPQSKVVPSVRGRPALSVMGQPSVSLSSPDTPTPILFRYNTAPLCHSSPFQQQWADALQCFLVFPTLVFRCQGGKPPIVFTPMDFLPPDSHAGRRKRKYILAYAFYGLKEWLKWPKKTSISQGWFSCLVRIWFW